jgi:flagellar hook-associated protein 1
VSNLLNIGKTGLDASKKSLETTGHNIANANTEGYTRQRIHQTTNTPISKGGLISGTGARVVSVNRVHDQFVEKQLNSSISSNDYYKTRSEELAQVENVFNEIEQEGLNHVLNRFYNSFRDLANQPENEAVRSVVRDSANLVTKDFHRIRSTLDDHARKIDKQLQIEIEDINIMSKRIAKINNEIARLEVGGQTAPDLRDQRDLIVRTLSESFDIHTYLDEKNRYVVSAKNVGTLVAGSEIQEFAVKPMSRDESSNNMDGSYEIVFAKKSGHPITDKFTGGRVAALAEIRNTDIKSLQERIDNIAFEFSNSINAIHRRGYVNRELKTNEVGDVFSVDRKGPTTGINFFNTLNERENAASEIDLSSFVKEDLSNVATALNPNSPGDNRVAIAISKLQHEKIMSDGTSTLEEDYLQMIGRVGIDAGKSNFDLEQSSGLLAQAVNMRERISGVSIDEETANMVRYQHAYDASARVMKTADDMFKTVLGIMR